MKKDTANELMYRLKADQAMRRGETEWDDTLDANNTEYMHEVIEEYGWPLLSKDGAEVAHAAWLLVQHADKDPEFQARCLELMKALPEGEVELSHIAFLDDRVRVNAHKPQLYGTQFYRLEDQYMPRPIEDIGQLDKRRAAMGLESFSDYAKTMRELYDFSAN